MDMIKEMINNMLGEYSKFIQIQDDGTVKVFVPEDVNNPSMENATELTLSKNEAISLMGLVTQPKQYEVCDSPNNCRIISEKDPDFDVNKWIKLALGLLKNKYYVRLPITITTVREKCPFDAKRKSKEYCKVCKAWKDPCSGLGIETTISSRKIGEDKMKQIINIIK